MVRREGSREIARNAHPRRAFSFMSHGIKTKGWDKNPPRSDCPYVIFGKRMQRTILGFGSIGTAFYSRKLISEAVLNEMYGLTNVSKGDMRYFHQRLEAHRDDETTEYEAMQRAVRALLRRFPALNRDLQNINETSKPLFDKVKLITKGMNAARSQDANTIRNDIFILAASDAKKRGWSMPTTLQKADRGIKSDCTARFFLPLAERAKYLADRAGYREQVERNIIKITLSNTWSAILYDEDMVDEASELSGLFRSETLLRCGITIFCGPSAGRNWKFPEPGARSFASSRKECNAEINGITRITPEAIAYVSTLVVFSVHDGKTFTRDSGDLDLSEVYHDVVAALRTNTKWAEDTVKFWNRIFFGERTEEEPTQKVSRKHRFKQIEADQLERESLEDPSPPSQSNPSHATNPRGRIANNAANSEPPPPDSDAEDPAAVDNSAVDHPPPRKQVPISDERPSQPKPNQKRPRDDSPVPSGEEDYEYDSPVPPQRKRIKRKGTNTSTPSRTSSQEQDDPVQPGPEPRITEEEWDDTLNVLRTLVKRAKAVGFKNYTRNLAALLPPTTTESAIRAYNKNYDALELVKAQINNRFNALFPSSPQDDSDDEDEALELATTFPRPGTSKSAGTPKDPTPTPPVPKKKKPQRTRKRVPAPVGPPKNTRSVAAAQRAHKVGDEAEDSDGPTTEPAMMKLPV